MKRLFVVLTLVNVATSIWSWSVFRQAAVAERAYSSAAQEALLLIDFPQADGAVLEMERAANWMHVAFDIRETALNWTLVGYAVTIAILAALWISKGARTTERAEGRDAKI